MSNFSHLNVTSAFSMQHGTTVPEQLVAAAAADGASAAALTDQFGLYGAVRHIRSCLATGLSPIIGTQIRIRPPASGRPIPAASTGVTVLGHGGNRGAGWAALTRLLSAAYRPPRAGAGLASGEPMLTAARLAAFVVDHEGVAQATVLLGAESDVGQAVLRGETSLARRLLDHWRQLTPAVAIEVVCHYTEPGTARSLPQATELLELALAAQVNAVLTNEVRYLAPHDAMTGDVLDAVARWQSLGSFTPQPNGQAWLKPAAMMHQVAYEIGARAAHGSSAGNLLLTNTEELAVRCGLVPAEDIGWRQPKTPELDVLGYDSSDPELILRQQCLAGISDRYDTKNTTSQAVLARLDEELKTIFRFGFASYFLTVADVSRLIRSMNIRAQARGSGAGSLVNYLLGISQVDPIEHDLLFERFLGAARSTLPDIDIDVEAARRHDIYRAIVARYGDHRVSLLSMHNTYRARSAIRDVGLALGLPSELVDSLAKSVWRINARDLRPALAIRPELRSAAELVDTQRQLDLLVDLIATLDRLPRHISMHPCGVILGDNNLLSLTPVQPSGMGLPMSQFDKDDIDDLGLLKLDVLGVRMQSSMAYALAEIQRTSDEKVDLERIPRDDEATFSEIRTTNTLGIFQLESPGQRELIGKLQPDRYSDLIADISLFRPGPMQANMVNPFIAAKHGYQKPPVLHPDFTGFLADSYGVVIYHEHVLRILSECLGVTLGMADEIRRKLTAEIDLIGPKFQYLARQQLDSAGNRRFTDRQIDIIWQTIASFGAFGFCKAHAASFALPTYQSAWLKVHYPVEFMAGILEYDPGMYPRRLLMAEARRMKISLLGLDVNLSTDQYRIELQADGQKGIRLSLNDVRGITQTQLKRILEGQPYDSIEDFYHRASPSRPLLKRLAQVGALDSLVDATRGDVLAHVRKLAAAGRPELCIGQLPLPLAAGREIETGHPPPDRAERIHAELEVLASEVTEHVMTLYQPLLSELEVTSAADLLGLRNGSPVRVAGIRVATQTPPTPSGRRVVFISLDDGTGTADCSFFEQAQEASGPALFGPRMLVVSGRTRRTGERGITVQAESALDLKPLWREWSAAVSHARGDLPTAGMS